ncbi:MAG TPA: HD-GYP domain-containing protein [Acidobacteriaceae bacterium]|nr:HD-GYP domain-containing protein [Acidobacteriaceae bacterium]
MLKLPARTARQSSLPGMRIRWRVFARFLAIFAGATSVTVLAMLLAQRTLGAVAAGWAVALIELLGSAAAALLLTLWLERRMQRLLHVLESGAGEAHIQNPDDLFSDILPAWHRTLRTFRDKSQEKTEEARSHYETLKDLMRMVAKAVDERTAYLRGHSERVAAYAAAIAWKLGLDEHQVERVRLAALLHDIGCLGVEDYLVMKNTPLSPEEFEIVKAHTVKGAAILRPITMLQDLVPGVELHHESLDGMGYPYGLRGEQIPLMARIVAVADSFDAMTTPRPYQAAMNATYVLDILTRLSGTRYDPVVVIALAELVNSGALEIKDVRTPVSFRMRKPVPELV